MRRNTTWKTLSEGINGGEGVGARKKKKKTGIQLKPSTSAVQKLVQTGDV